MMDAVHIPSVRLHRVATASCRLPLAGWRSVTAGGGGIVTPPQPGDGVDNLLAESGYNLLLEDGGVFLLETEVVKQLNV